MKRQIRFAPDPVFTDILPRYPENVNDAERNIAESTLRAMFLSVFHGRETTPATLDWYQRLAGELRPLRVPQEGARTARPDRPREGRDRHSSR